MLIGKINSINCENLAEFNKFCLTKNTMKGKIDEYGNIVTACGRNSEEM